MAKDKTDRQAEADHQRHVRQRIQDYKDAKQGDEAALDRYFGHLHRQYRETRARRKAAKEMWEAEQKGKGE